ncbi:MAG: hypothetical protein EOP84_04245 [Verrucomicrobiaceae bacterium]|nr:MAG: hypothetical protein EOP84_04245 [Verrucomicrobiaceae bacterium]
MPQQIEARGQMTRAAVMNQRLDLESDIGVTVTSLGPGSPCRIEPVNDDLRSDPGAPSEWVRENKAILDALLVEAGAILFRGFRLDDAAAFGAFFSAYGDHVGGYVGGTSPRDRIVGRVMESTVVPADRVIPIHQEMAYSPRYPAKVAFFCELPPTIGGETPVCDMRLITQRLPPSLAENVRRLGLKYWRHFREPDYLTGEPKIDIVHRTWQDAFSTKDRHVAEAAVRTLGSTCEWTSTGLLVSNLATGFANHPQTGESIWFNQVAGYSFTADVVGAEMEALHKKYYASDRPAYLGVTYGDGTEIDRREVAKLNEITRQIQVSNPWERGDALLLDNILCGHGKNAFEGQRKIRVSLLT